MKSNKQSQRFLPILLVIITILCGIILGILQVQPLSVDKKLRHTQEYSDMMKNIQAFTAAPHETGSTEIAVVRNAILNEIKQMGLDPTLEKEEYTPAEFGDVMMWRSGTTRDKWWASVKETIIKEYNIYSFEDWYKKMAEGEKPRIVQNIHVTIDAPDAEQGLLFVSHYDSTPNGPGAADDMLSVCSMLEAMRRYAQDNTIKTDLHFLFTDCEEDTMLGAWKFVKNHPEMKEKTKLVINLEARGNSGGMLLFQTSPQAYSWIKMAIEAGISPISFSWLPEAYKLLPNYTDLLVFLNAKYNGINFAAMEGVEHYHQPSDNFSNLSRSTAGQYLNTTLAFADYAAKHRLDEWPDSKQEGVYFTFFPGNLILITSQFARIITALISLFFVCLLGHKIHKNQLKMLHIIAFVLLAVLSNIIAILFVGASYLFFIPLLFITVTMMLQRWKLCYYLSTILTGFTTLLLWIPVFYILWMALLEPKLFY